MKNYDFTRRRWFSKKLGTRWSEYVLGPRKNSTHMIEHGEILVSAYRTKSGHLRYSGPVTDPNNIPGPGVLYRVRVKLKERVTA